MNLRRIFFAAGAMVIFATACAEKHSDPVAPAPTAAAVIPPTPQYPLIPAANPAPTNLTISTAPTYVPDYSHSGQPLPDGLLAWDNLNKAVDAAADQDFARFAFSFTNISQDKIVILNVHPSCGCTTAELPPTPWIIPAGASGIIKLNVNLAGKFGTVFKSATVTTEKGKKDLLLRINIQPPVVKKLTDAERMDGIAKAKVDRQAVFHGDCASCHAKNIEGKYGVELYNSVCGVCHDAEHRATMVPNLSTLTIPTSPEFWRTWITYGKPGSLMPAFATSQGGPLTDMQIQSLAVYLSASHPTVIAIPAQ